MTESIEKKALIASISDLHKNQVKDAIRDHLHDVYLCSRVWEAWSFGTMTADDFYHAADDEEFISEIADAAILALLSKENTNSS